MKKIIVKFWSVGLLLALLSTLFVGAAAPAAAADYALTDSYLGPWSPTTFIPGTTLAPVAKFGIQAADQSGSTIYAIGGNTVAGYFALEKSTDGGATWAATATGITAVAQNFTMIAVAPDNPAIVALVDTVANAVYLSTTGGTLFSSLGVPGGAINGISISPKTLYQYITVATANGIATWTLGVAAPSWALDNSHGAAYAVAYSPNFAADAGLLVVTANSTATGIAGSSANLSVSVYSNNLLLWDPTGYGYPEQINSLTNNARNSFIAIGMNKATITLDPNFYLGDSSTQIGFIGIASSNVTVDNGVYRFDLNTAGTVTQIFTAAAVNSVAWDGTNLMVAPYIPQVGNGGITIYRSANALAASTVVSFLTSSAYKTPGTGYFPIVMFNGGSGYAFSSGNNSAIAKTMDEGKSFDGFALVNSNFNNIQSFQISADGSRIYALVNDGADTNLWRFEAGSWNRVFTLAGGATPGVGNWLVRMDADNPDTVFIGAAGGTTMYKSLDAGESWTIRASAIQIGDFAVQDANNLYVTSNVTDAWVYKSTNGAFTWVPYATPLTDGGVGYSIKVLSDNNVIMGTSTGYITYTTDGATWSMIPYPVTAGNTVVTADSLNAGGVIWAASPASSISSWTVGTSVAWAVTTAATTNVTGLVEAGGLVYGEASSGTANTIYRFLNPGFGAGWFYQPLATGPGGGGTGITRTGTALNSLQATVTGGSVNIWASAINTSGPVDTLDTYADSLVAAATAPAPISPINATKIPVNSLNGNVGNFVFQWNSPAVLPFTPAQTYSFDVAVYLDQAGTILAGFAGGVDALTPGGVGVSYSTGGGAWAPVLNFNPGTTYYWQVRVTTPVWSYYCPMQTFTIGALQAVVPTLGSPAFGATLASGQTAAFGWSPITGTATYDFQLSVDPSFATTVYEATTTSAGAELPSNIHLIGGTTYFWRVKALTPTEGDWSTVGNFLVAKAVPSTTATTTAVVTPTTTIVTSIVIPQPTQTVITVPPATQTTTEVNPSYIWAIIIIGAVLVIAVIVLIVRTRRSV